ncbi:hypothetical protein J5N97_010506 [Dioscorea zingiberensis]|uniref:G domain-containing protein n=1 Tax=Dioscorea zingiberensis TaxID=325984 RepID=A0A9D5CYV3_9LILI|nr:hypothetical protein J5N97_010506 [Dioscorea zingiberensis]
MAAAPPLRLHPLCATPPSPRLPSPLLFRPLLLNDFHSSSLKMVSTGCLKTSLPIVPAPTEQEDGFSDEDDVQDGQAVEDDGISPLDLEFMEEEARVAVREYTRSLSQDEVYVKKEVGVKKKSRSSDGHGTRLIVVDEPGVTRDRLYGRSFWGEYQFMVVDTGGVMTLSKSQVDVMEELAITTTVGMDGIPLASREAAVARMPSMIEKQAISAVEEAAVIIFLVDGQAGLMAADVEISDWLRKNYSNRHIILAVNKCESPRKGLMQASEFWSLGLSPLPVSAVSGSGTGELLDLVCSGLKTNKAFENSEEEKEDYIPSIAIVGRPNVGKSSILNALVGEDRTIVSPISGTTRDAIDTEFTGQEGQKYRLIDTAGIRRRAAVSSSDSDVVALVIEALACITEQDYRIAERIEREGKGCVIVVNKWDTIPNKNQQTTAYYEQDVREKLRELDWAPIVYSTATCGQSVDK